jgi:oxygen-independent coproporphyrinogen-3 oxidase
LKLPSESGLYIHFPFCRKRCHYCDFNTYAVPDIPTDGYTEAILKEFESRAHLLDGTQLTTIFLGGGTPGLWGAKPVEKVLRAVKDRFPSAPLEEITLEVNPGECDEDMLRAYREESGCTRVSFGVQAMEDGLLQSMDRIHSAEEARDAMRAAAKVGFESWSVDLIFGLPGQTMERWVTDLREVLSFSPPHLSVYNLMVEPGTPLAMMVRDEKVHLPPDELQLEMLAFAAEEISRQGLARYEISNFSLENHHSQHNLLYWTGRPYLGLGAGAHGFIGNNDDSPALGKRQVNIRKYTEYMKSVSTRGEAIAGEEIIDGEMHLRERLMTGLRLDAGVDLKELAEITGLDPAHRYAEVLKGLEEEGLITRRDERISLTPTGLPVSDAVFLRFF